VAGAVKRPFRCAAFAAVSFAISGVLRWAVPVQALWRLFIGHAVPPDSALAA
jgi:hypothetical protein